MGMLFPAFVAAARGRVGGVYAWNTLGAIAGAFVATLALLPWLGTEGALAAGLFCYAAALAAVEPRPVPLAFALLLLWPAARPTDPLVTNVGAYLFGRHASEQSRALFHEDGPSASVLVRENPSGTRTPRGVSVRYISASDAVLPPTSGTSSILSSSNQRM